MLSAIWENCWRKRDKTRLEPVHAAVAVTLDRFHDVAVRFFFNSWSRQTSRLDASHKKKHHDILC